MNKKQVLVLALAFAGIAGRSQTTFVSDFESVTLPDYHGEVYNDSTNGAGGFQNGHAFFPTAWSQFGAGGWVASSVGDSSTAGYTNMYGCIAYKGYSNSNTFGIANLFGNTNIRLTDSLMGKTVMGLYVCNATYAYKSERNGDGFAKKFGDTTGTNCGCSQGAYPDWFKLTIKKYYGGVITNDSVEVYLADYRFANSAQDYILKTWTWVDLTALGSTDSLAFFLHSSDNGSFGMNTPAYFCIDDLTLKNAVGIEERVAENGLYVFPNPAAAHVEIKFNTTSATYVSMKVVDVTGREMLEQHMTSFAGENKWKADVSDLPRGIYYVVLTTSEGVSSKKLIRQ